MPNKPELVYVKVYLGSACINEFHISRVIRSDEGRQYVIFRGSRRYIIGRHGDLPLIMVS